MQIPCLILATAILLQPQPVKVADRQFWALTATTFIALTVDVELMQYKLHKYPGTYERNPFLPRYPTRARMYAQLGAQRVLATYISYRLKQSKRWHKWWWLPQVVEISSSSIGVELTLQVGQHRR